MPGIQMVMPDNMNDFFSADYPDMSFNIFSSSGGGYWVFHNFIMGGESGEYNGGPFIKDSKQVDLTGEFGSFQLGYIILQKGKLTAYPLIGLRTNSMEIFIHETVQSETFNGIVDQPYRSTVLKHESTTLNVSMNTFYLVGGKMTDNGGGGFVLGLQVGYQLPAFKREWSFDNGSIIGGPGFDMSGFYFRFIIPRPSLRGMHQITVKRFKEALKSIKDRFKTINIISHSWGTVIAYQALKNFNGEINRFITMGSPLPENVVIPPALKNPEHWINIYSKKDHVVIKWAGRKLWWLIPGAKGYLFNKEGIKQKDVTDNIPYPPEEWKKIHSAYWENEEVIKTIVEELKE